MNRKELQKRKTKITRTCITVVTVGLVLLQALTDKVQAQDNQNNQSVFQSRLDDANAVYFLKENFALFGDGISDDAPALQKAINLVEEQSTNGIVFIPEGTYRLAKTVYIWRGIKLVGYGKTRPVFVMGDNTPGFQDGNGKYMVHFCDRRNKEGEPVLDAQNTTMFSEMNNINIVLGNGNPAAVAIRFHVAQHCALKNMDFQIGSSRAGVEDMGNVIENCNFYGGEWGIKTGRTSPGWQALVLDCNFEAQRKASIQTEDAGMTVIRCRFSNAPTAVLVAEGNERLFIKDCRFEKLNQPAIKVKNYFDPKTQVNLENLLFSDVPVSLEYGAFGHGTSRSVPLPDKDENGVVSYKAPGLNYRIQNYCHGLVLENTAKSLERDFTTINEQEPLETPGKLPQKDYPDLPLQEKWVNIVDLGAKGDGETDDTQVFKSAIEKYEVIYIPLGSYLLSETLFLKEKTALIGLHPSMTRLCLKPETPGFTDANNLKPLLVSPKGGSNIVTGIGFYLEVNPGAIAVKWMAGSSSYMDDTFFSGRWRAPKGDGECYGLWVTDGGGGTFKNIWAPNQQAKNGLYISNTSTEGRMYEISVEHHKDIEVKLDNVSNWSFYNLQTEENGGSENCIAVEIDNCSNLTFANYVSYRVMAMRTPAVAAFEINNSSKISIKGSRVNSGGAFPYDNTVYIKDRGILVPQHEFTKLIVK